MADDDFRDERGRFICRPPNAGRPKGTQNRVNAAVKECLRDSFHRVGGTEWLVGLARTDPRTYAALLSRLIPAEIAQELQSPGGVQIIVSTGLPASPGKGVKRLTAPARLPAGSVESTAVTEVTRERSTGTENSNREQDDSELASHAVARENAAQGDVLDADEIIKGDDGSPRWRVTRPWEGKQRPRQAKL